MILPNTAEHALELCTKAGAAEAAVEVRAKRGVGVSMRDGAFEDITESSTQALTVEIYVDGRYSSHNTSDLRPDAIQSFVEKAVALTRVLGKDPHRGLADPSLYAGQPEIDLKLSDPGLADMTIEDRKTLAEAAHDGARAVDGILSVTSSAEDVKSEFVRMHSNGFAGSETSTLLYCYAHSTCDDPSGRKPNDYEVIATRWRNALEDPHAMGVRASQRAKRRLAQQKLETAKRTVVVENRAARSLLSHAISPLKGRMLQQNRSFWEGRLGETVASKAFTLVDDPHVPGGFGSRLFDSDGITSRRRELFNEGVLTEYLIDVYYARKMNVAPTGGSTSNLRLAPGKQSPDALIASVKDGVYVTSFQGGNSDSTRGEFSHGIAGFAIRDGKIAEPVGEMNLSGNHVELWQRLVAVGNDPYLYGSMQTPTLVLEDVTVSGS